MKIIFNIIAFPVTAVISIICFLFVLIFESDFKTRDGVSAVQRISNESGTLLLNEMWSECYPFLKAVISIGVYYLIFF